MRDRLAGPRSCLTRDSDDALVTGLARMLAHELGEIAALFDGYIAYLEERPPDGVVCLRRTTERLRRVYEGLLELADVASSQPSRSAVDPATVVAAARRRLRAASDASDPDIDVRVRALPVVVADPGQLENLFIHLLRSAAIQASSTRPVVVIGSREGIDVRLDIGADPLRDRASTEPGADSLVGHGVELAVSRQIAERNGGRLWVTSTDRSGTTISLTLPAADP